MEVAQDNALLIFLAIPLLLAFGASYSEYSKSKSKVEKEVTIGHEESKSDKKNCTNTLALAILLGGVIDDKRKK